MSFSYFLMLVASCCAPLARAGLMLPPDEDAPLAMLQHSASLTSMPEAHAAGRQASQNNDGQSAMILATFSHVSKEDIQSMMAAMASGVQKGGQETHQQGMATPALEGDAEKTSSGHGVLCVAACHAEERKDESWSRKCGWVNCAGCKECFERKAPVDTIVSSSSSPSSPSSPSLRSAASESEPAAPVRVDQAPIASVPPPSLVSASATIEDGAPELAAVEQDEVGQPFATQVGEAQPQVPSPGVEQPPVAQNIQQSARALPTLASQAGAARPRLPSAGAAQSPLAQSVQEQFVQAQPLAAQQESALAGEPCDANSEVAHQGHCYYLDGSGGQCDAGYELAPQSVLHEIAPKFEGRTYRHTAATTCCIAHRDQMTEGQNFGLLWSCGRAGQRFKGNDVFSIRSCGNANQQHSEQLTLCVSSDMRPEHGVTLVDSSDSSPFAELSGLPAFSRECFWAGRDMAARDAACATGFVCARRSFDGRDYGDCEGHHCCSQVPKNVPWGQWLDQTLAQKKLGNAPSRSLPAPGGMGPWQQPAGPIAADVGKDSSIGVVGNAPARDTPPFVQTDFDSDTVKALLSRGAMDAQQNAHDPVATQYMDKQSAVQPLSSDPQLTAGAGRMDAVQDSRLDGNSNMLLMDEAALRTKFDSQTIDKLISGGAIAARQDPSDPTKLQFVVVKPSVVDLATQASQSAVGHAASGVPPTGQVAPSANLPQTAASSGGTGTIQGPVYDGTPEDSHLEENANMLWLDEAQLRSKFDSETIDRLIAQGAIEARQNPVDPTKMQFYVNAELEAGLATRPPQPVGGSATTSAAQPGQTQSPTLPTQNVVGTEETQTLQKGYYSGTVPQSDYDQPSALPVQSMPESAQGMVVEKFQEQPDAFNECPSLFVAVMSSADNYQRRAAVRNMWKDADLGYGSEVSAKFVVCAHGGILPQLQAENAQYGDLLFLNCDEGSAHGALTRKLSTAMRAFLAYGTYELFMKIDDDTWVSTRRLCGFINQKRAGGKDMANAYMGVFYEEGETVGTIQSPIRDPSSPVYEPFEKFPNAVYPLSAKGGPGYILSKSIVQNIIQSGISDVNQLNNEDKAVGVWVQKVASNKPVQYINLPGTDGYDERMSKLLTGAGGDRVRMTGSFADYPYIVHHRMQTGAISCMHGLDLAQDSAAKPINPCFQQFSTPFEVDDAAAVQALNYFRN